MVWKIYSIGGTGLAAKKDDNNILLARNRRGTYNPIKDW